MRRRGSEKKIFSAEDAVDTQGTPWFIAREARKPTSGLGKNCVLTRAKRPRVPCVSTAPTALNLCFFSLPHRLIVKILGT